MTAGVQEVLLALPGDTRRSVFRIIRDRPPRAYVSVNRLRDELDAAGIPMRSRGAYLLAAERAGLIEPVRRVIDGWEVTQTETSTNPGSRRSRVTLYRRVKENPR